MQSFLAPNAGSWLITPPDSVLGLHMEAKEFQSCVKYRLGTPIYDALQDCPYCKNSVIYIYGDHSVTRGGREDNIHRHDRLRDKVFSSGVSADFSPSLKKRTLAATTNPELQTFFYAPGLEENQQRLM